MFKMSLTESVIVAAVTLYSSVVCAAEAVPVGAAADLKFALPEIAKAFEAETGQKIALTFGASGQLTTQIERGAPFEVFLSADEALVKRLADQGLTRDEGKLYALGRVALYVPEASPIEVDGELKGLKAAVAAGRVKKFAIANPEHAPYGRAGKAALEAAGIWADISPHIVLGENIAQTFVFATEGGADGALVSESLLSAESAKAMGRHAVLADTLVKPLRQRLAVMKIATPAAAAFADYVTSDKGQAILAKFGFSKPDGP